MSMIACSECRRLVNTDDDPDCFVEVGNMRRLTSTIVLCEPCREEHQAEQDYAPWERGEP